MNNCVEINLPGTADELTAIFSYTKAEQDTKLTTLESYIAHAFNLTLTREHFFGAWAQVLQNNGQFVLKMYSIHHDLTPYKSLIPAYIEAGKTGLSIYKANQAEIDKVGQGQMQFLLPFGLSMCNSKSVQLLHFPPLETLVYQDYLYSPTNRRWENLLGYNNPLEKNFSELETIVDCVPIAAPGDDSKGIAPFNNLFTAYVKQMLQARMIPKDHHSQPIVAYGEPVMAWLEQNFGDQIKPQIPSGRLAPLSLIELEILGNNIKTPLLCANHPSKYLYYTDDNKPVDAPTKKEIMLQDLIAAGWHDRMSHHPTSDAKIVLEELTKHWTNNPRVEKIMAQEDVAYGYLL